MFFNDELFSLSMKWQVRKPKLAILLLAVLIISSFTVYATFAEEKRIPFWIKDAAKFWVEGSVSDQEFLNAIEWLLNNGIIKVSGSTDLSKQLKLDPSFSGVTCHRDSYAYVIITGKYTNDDRSYERVYIRGALLDASDNVLAASNVGDILKNVKPFETKIISVPIAYEGNYSTCYVEIEDKN